MHGEDPPTKARREKEEAEQREKDQEARAAEELRAEQDKAVRRETRALKYEGIPKPFEYTKRTGTGMDVGEAKANTASQMEECDHRLREISHTKAELSTSIGIIGQIGESTDSENADNAVQFLSQATRELEEAYDHVSRAKEDLNELLLKLNRL